jgi:2,3-dihydroxyphenylpropionate 1,2-dioxygenase
LPRVSRCAELGAAIRRAIDAFPGRRVAVIASGGLSHRLPWPDWRTPNGEDEAFLVEAFLNGRANWTDYEVRRREIVIKATTDAGDAFRVNTAFDRAFLELVEGGQLGALLQRSGDNLLADAGNGGQEIRTWIAMTAALGNAPGRILAYEDIPEWLTGMAVAVLA